MSKRREDMALTISNAEVYNHYRERLINLALSQFEWHGLPETMDRWYLEKTLFYHGSAAVYQPQGTDFWLGTSWLHTSGLFNVYGRPTGLVGIDFNGRNIPTDNFHLIYDNNTRVPLIAQIDVVCKQLYETHQTFRSNLKFQNTPYIIATTKNELLSVKNLFKRIFAFDPVVEVRGGFDGSIDQAVKPLDMKVPYIGTELIETRRTLWADALSILGITSETTKKERLISDEIAINRQEDSITLNSRLLNRVEFCNFMNEKYGWDISVNISETAINAALPGGADDSGQSSQSITVNRDTDEEASNG